MLPSLLGPLAAKFASAEKAAPIGVVHSYQYRPGCAVQSLECRGFSASQRWKEISKVTFSGALIIVT